MHLPRALVVAFSGPVYRCSLNTRRSVRTQRAISEASVRALRPPRGTRVQRTVLAARPAERVTFGDADGATAVLYLHGGGYVVGSARMYRALAAHLARACGATVYTLDYRLAPEHPYPAALDDAEAAFRELADARSPGRIAIAGDSAGGGLAVATARRLVDSGVRPGALALLSPWTDPSDHDLPVRDFVVNRAWGAACAAMYRGDTDPTDPGYAPMHADLAGLPPMLIHTGAAEMLNAQIKRFAARAESAGVPVDLVEHARLWHSGHVVAGLLREATDAVADAGRHLRGRLEVPAAAH